MYQFVRTRKRVVQIILGLLMVPFALFGIETYQRNSSAADVIAKVGSGVISRQEFAQAWQSQQERARQMFGRSFDAAVFDTPKAREGTLERLISQRLLAEYVVRAGVLVTDADLQRSILAIDAFREDGKFSIERYQQLIRAQGMTPQGFESTLRQDLALQKVNEALVEGAIVSKTIARQTLALSSAQREIAEHLIDVGRFLAQVKPSAEAVEAFYKDNPKQFEVPEQARVEYVVLNQEMVAAQEAVSEAEVRKTYDDNFGAKAKARAEARARAEALLVEIRRTPGRFAELAKANSQDEGSAVQGGDLGLFGRGMMVKPFEEAVFRMKPGETSGLVETDFGFHIIRLTEVKPGDKPGAGEERRASHILIKAPAGVQDFAAARAGIESEIRRSRAAGRFNKIAEDFQNLADQDQDSLAPFVERFKLQMQTSDWITRQGDPRSGVLAKERVLEAIFKPETIKAKRATEAVEVASGVLVVARVLEHKPSFVRPLDQVRADVTREVVQREASALARKIGADVLASIQKGEGRDLKFSTPKLVSREESAGLPPESVRTVFKADSTTLPAHVGVELANGGYAIYRISRVAVPEPDEKRITEYESTAARADGGDQSDAFVAALRSRMKVTINRENLQNKVQ